MTDGELIRKSGMRLFATGFARMMIVIAISVAELAVIACGPASWEIAAFVLTAALVAIVFRPGRIGESNEEFGASRTPCAEIPSGANHVADGDDRGGLRRDCSLAGSLLASNAGLRGEVLVSRVHGTIVRVRGRTHEKQSQSVRRIGACSERPPGTMPAKRPRCSSAAPTRATVPVTEPGPSKQQSGNERPPEVRGEPNAILG